MRGIFFIGQPLLTERLTNTMQHKGPSMRPLPIGIDDFEKIISQNYHYVDKSLFIKELLDYAAGVTLIPRPRRFGKTLNLSMLKYFFEKTAISRASLFDGLNIAKHPEYMKHQGQYPVIFLTFKFIEGETWEMCFEKMKRLIANEFERHAYLLESVALSPFRKKEFQKIIELSASDTAYEVSLKDLTMYLAKHHNQKPIVLLDEYDVPMQNGFKNNYYNKAAQFMRLFIGDGLKGNDYLNFGVITGCMRISKESIFTGLNNPDVCTILGDAYSDKFGLLESEVKSLLKECGIETCQQTCMEEIRAWYNGFSSGHHTIYNPWSIINFINKKCEFNSYWVNSSSNDIIKKLIKNSDEEVKEEIAQLLQGKTICKRVDENIVFADLDEGQQTALWNFLLFSGYLSFKNLRLDGTHRVADLFIPNKEIVSIYESTILGWFSNKEIRYNTMLQYLVDGNITEFTKLFEKFVIISFGYFDVGNQEAENFYHAFVLGILATLATTHFITSNRESGLGRYDVKIAPHDKTKPAIIIEFKKVEPDEHETLESAAASALQQITNKRYAIELEHIGYTHIIPLAIVFKGKQVLVRRGL